VGQKSAVNVYTFTRSGVDKSTKRAHSAAIATSRVTHVTHDVTKTPDKQCGRSVPQPLNTPLPADTGIMIIIFCLPGAGWPGA